MATQIQDDWLRKLGVSGLDRVTAPNSNATPAASPAPNGPSAGVAAGSKAAKHNAQASTTTPPTPEPSVQATTSQPESEGLLDRIEDAAGRAVDRVKGLAHEAASTVRHAWERLTPDKEPESPTPASQPAAAPPVAPKAVEKDPAAPKFKGYPKGLETAEKLIDQVKKYGFSEGIHATSSDADDREDTKEIWCSGLSNWSLLESGIDIDAKFGHPTGRMKKDKKTGEMVPEERNISIRGVVEGTYSSWGGTPPELDPIPTAKDFPDPAELKEKIAETKAKNKVASEAATAVAYQKEGLFGNTAAEDDPRVKGAAGAFVLAGIGKEITDLKDVKPGDYVQTRVVRSPEGHAFQIHACECIGEALIGPGGGPTLIKDQGGDRIKTKSGIWYANARFKIDGRTDPEMVGKHEVVKTDILESNIKGAMEDKKKHPDGGVQIRHNQQFADPAKGGKRTYVGRLSSSSWTGYDRNAPPLVRPEGETIPAGS